MLTVSEKPTTNIELIPPGVYVANCYGVIDLGTLENKYTEVKPTRCLSNGSCQSVAENLNATVKQ